MFHASSLTVTLDNLFQQAIVICSLVGQAMQEAMSWINRCIDSKTECHYSMKPINPGQQAENSRIKCKQEELKHLMEVQKQVSQGLLLQATIGAPSYDDCPK